MTSLLILILVMIFIYSCSYYLYKNYFHFPPIDEQQLNNKRVIITGASRGIGEELAYEYARYKCRLILAARSINRLQDEVSKECHRLGASEVHCIYFDAFDEQSCVELIEKTKALYDGIDILVLNHTASVYESFFEQDPMTNIGNMKKLLQTNFYGYFLTAMYALPHLTQSGTSEHASQIIAVSSLAGACPLPKTTIYGTTKHAIQGFFLNLARELRQSKVHKNRVTSTVAILGLISTEQALKETDRSVHFLAADVRRTAQAILAAGVYGQARVFYPYHFALIPPLYYLLTPIFEALARLGN